jgi:hypothetical protein
MQFLWLLLNLIIRNLIMFLCGKSISLTIQDIHVK